MLAFRAIEILSAKRNAFPAAETLETVSLTDGLIIAHTREQLNVSGLERHPDYRSARVLLRRAPVTDANQIDPGSIPAVTEASLAASRSRLRRQWGDIADLVDTDLPPAALAAARDELVLREGSDLRRILSIAAILRETSFSQYVFIPLTEQEADYILLGAALARKDDAVVIVGDAGLRRYLVEGYRMGLREPPKANLVLAGAPAPVGQGAVAVTARPGSRFLTESTVRVAVAAAARAPLVLFGPSPELEEVRQAMPAETPAVYWNTDRQTRRPRPGLEHLANALAHRLGRMMMRTAKMQAGIYRPPTIVARIQAQLEIAIAGLARLEALASSGLRAAILLDVVNPYNRIFAMLCRRRGVRTVQAQVLLTVLEDLSTKAPRPPREDGSRPYGYEADAICVILDSYRNAAIHYGAAADAVHLVGAVRSDIIRERAVRDRGRKTSERFTIGFAIQPTYMAETQANLHAIRAYADSRQGVELVIRPHPKMRANEMHVLQKDFPETAVVRWDHGGDATYFEFLGDIDVAATFFSQVGLEASLIDTPVICPNLTGRSFPVSMAREGYAVELNTPKDIETVLDRLRHGAGVVETPEAAAFHARNPDLGRGSAADRIVDIALR